MTREEAIDNNKNLRMYMRLSDKNQPYKFLEENYIALDMAIKALEQELIFEEIKAEALSLKINYTDFDRDAYRRGINDVLKIIDKYKTESEPQERSGEE